MPDLFRENLSQTGKTYSLDFCIGNIQYLGKGLAAPTLEAFVQFIHKEIDPLVDTFFIDPDANNRRAIHVYKKAGFKMTSPFPVDKGFFKESHSLLMVKRLY